MNNWNTCSIIIQGTSHIKENKPCQDKVCIRKTESAIVAVLADGLSTLDYSEEAAKISTSYLTDRLAMFDSSTILNLQFDDLRNEILRSIRQEINNYAQSKHISIKDMDCTLLFVYIGIEEQMAIVGQLGDGAICLFNDHDAFLFDKPDKTSANGTKAIFSPDANNHFQIGKYNLCDEKIVGFILTSDGLENEVYIPIGSVKNNAALYINAVSTNIDTAETIINERIKTIVSNPDSEFDDDISIAIISQISYQISLSKETTWLCPCGNRNELQVTRCTYCNRDFVEIYRGKDFKLKGGKVLAFEWLNNNPEKEREFIGIITEKNHAVPVSKEITDKNLPEETRELIEDVEMGTANQIPNQGDTDSKKTTETGNNSINIKKGSKRGLNILACIGCFFLGMMVMAVLNFVILDKSFVFNDFGNIESDINEIKIGVKDIANSLNSQEPTETESTSYMNTKDDTLIRLKSDLYAVLLENSNLYIGKLKNQLPEGRGILLVGDEFHIGNFIAGKKEGTFVIVDSDDTIENILYDNNNPLVNDTTNVNSDNIESNTSDTSDNISTQQ